ncbi:hypothetical protein OU995_03500 [Roseateles sp. SL47]|uniref:hypothetical protein n=1 Tax=Roseateles sp. SL47 TaxID=2995138 RepID=UPI00226F64AE|nr:hypothetical protein [Roseateles sp. SL47]WAC73815.1 hypothetical protein OU995_03500 [Roseateles sp. SL47]
MANFPPIRRWLRQLAISVLSAAVVPAIAAALPQAPSLPEPLLHARFYAWGWVGTPAEQSPEERAARKLAKAWPAQQLVQALPQANAEGKLYILCIIRRLHPSQYSSALREAGLAPDATVSVFAGSVLQTLPARQLVDQLERSRCEPLTWPDSGPPSASAARPSR